MASDPLGLGSVAAEQESSDEEQESEDEPSSDEPDSECVGRCAHHAAPALTAPSRF